MSARLRFPELLRGSRSLAVSPSGSILNLAPTWAIDARRGDVDLVGSADPVPLTNGVLDPVHGAVQAVSMEIDETDFDGTPTSASLLYAPDSAALGITGDIDIRGAMGGIDDLTNIGWVPQKIMVAKFLPSPYETDWQFAIDLDGDPRFTWWPGGTGLLEAVDVAATEDPYSATPYRITRTSADGVVTAYVEDDADPDVTTSDGRNWRLIGTAAGTSGALSDTPGMTLSFMIGKGFGKWCQVYDGIDGDLVVDMDLARDATGGLTTGDTFTAQSGETWTLGDSCATFAVNRKAWIVGSPGESVDGPFTVPDDPALDIGTGDFTVAMVYEPTSVASSPADFRSLFFKANVVTIGTTGAGWGFVDYSPLGGVLFVMNDGAGFHYAGTAWTAGERHLLVATGDRDGNLNLYLDDTATPAATADISAATGSLTNALDLSFGSEPALLYGAALWARVLTAGELAKLPTLMGV